MSAFRSNFGWVHEYVGTQLNSRTVHCHRTIQLWTARKVNKVKVESGPTKTWQVLEISFLNLSNTGGEVPGRPISFSYIYVNTIITITCHYFIVRWKSEHRWIMRYWGTKEKHFLRGFALIYENNHDFNCLYMSIWYLMFNLISYFQIVTWTF